MTELESNLRSIQAEKNSKLIPDNIRAGVKIFDVTGTVEVMDSSDATASASNILSGKTAYIKGGKVSGTMPNVGALSVKPKPSSASSVYPYGYVSAVTIPSIATSIEENTNPKIIEVVSTGRETAGTITATVGTYKNCKVVAAITTRNSTIALDDSEWHLLGNWTLSPNGSDSQFLKVYEKIAQTTSETLTISQDSDKILLMTLMSFDTSVDLEILTSNSNDLNKFVTADVSTALQPNDFIITQAYRAIGDIKLVDVTSTEYTCGITGIIPRMATYWITGSATSGDATLTYNTSTEYSYVAFRFAEAFVPGNIKAGVKIMDMIGTLIEQVDGNVKEFATIEEMNASTGNVYGDYAIVIDSDNVFVGCYQYDGGKWVRQSISIDDATAVAGDIASGKTAYINGGKTTGTLTTITGANSDTIPSGGVSMSTTYTYVDAKPTGRDLNEKDKLYRKGSSLKVGIPNADIAGKAGLTPDLLKRNSKVLGVTGTYDGLDTSDANATSSDILVGKSAYVDGQKVIGTIDVLPALAETTASSISVESDRVVFGSVITERGVLDKDFTYKIGTPNSTLANRIGLTANKIQEGNTILGIEGTAEILNTDDANAVNTDLLKGKTAYVKGVKITGTIPSNGALNYTPSDVEQTIPAGYTTGGKVAAMDFESIQDYLDCLEMANKVIYGEDLVNYPKLKYINFNGIDTPFDTEISLMATSNWEIEFKIRPSVIKDWCSLISTGADGSADKHEVFINGDGSFVENLTGNSYQTVENIFTAGQDYTIRLVCNGTVYTSYVNNEMIINRSVSTALTSTSIKFGYRGGSDYQGYLYYLKMKSGDKTVFNGIPAKDKNTGIAGLYDEQNLKFMSASGTVQYEAGPLA